MRKFIAMIMDAWRLAQRDATIYRIDREVTRWWAAETRAIPWFKLYRARWDLDWYHDPFAMALTYLANEYPGHAPEFGYHIILVDHVALGYPPFQPAALGIAFPDAGASFDNVAIVGMDHPLIVAHEYGHLVGYDHEDGTVMDPMAGLLLKRWPDLRLPQ